MAYLLDNFIVMANLGIHIIVPSPELVVCRHKEPSCPGHMILIAKDIGMRMCLGEPDRLLLPRKCSPNNIPGDQVGFLLQINADLTQQPQEAEWLLHRDALW